MSKRRKPIVTTMSREEIMDTWIWLPRLQFCASLVLGKKWPNCNQDEQYEVRKYIIENYEL
jgi:hypothetical protein|tara:strand:+ start:4226 stop:4408 length:183 start_codon:yes stop_codon:yes gene_type:complete